MNKIKDILYDKNDILIALLIVALAAFVIYDRMGAIMEYPQLLAAEANAAGGGAAAEEPVDPAGPTEPGGDLPEDGGEPPAEVGTGDEPGESEGQGAGTEGAGTEGEGGETEDPVQPEPPAEQPTEIKIHIAPGSTGADIAQLLVNAGLMESATDFYNAVIAAEADTKLQAGDFTIPTDATPEQVVKIITGQ